MIGDDGLGEQAGSAAADATRGIGARDWVTGRKCPGKYEVGGRKYEGMRERMGIYLSSFGNFLRSPFVVLFPARGTHVWCVINLIPDTPNPTALKYGLHRV